MNHVALEVGDLDAALELYGRLFAFELRGRVPGAAFIDMGDQFIALMEGRRQAPDDERHFGLVVDDVAAVRAAVEREGLEIVHPGARGLDFRDPWGNHFQIVAYEAIQFERARASSASSASRQLGKSRRRGARSRSAGWPSGASGGMRPASPLHLLERVRDLEQRPLAERPRDELQADRQAGRAEAGRDRDRRAGEHADARVGAHPLDVGAHRDAVDLRRVLLLDRERARPA